MCVGGVCIRSTMRVGEVRGRNLVLGNLASGQNSVLTLPSDFGNVVSSLPPGVLMEQQDRDLFQVSERGKAVTVPLTS